MKRPRLTPTTARAASLLGLLLLPLSPLPAQSTVYWDVNGSTPGGAAGATADGVWSDSAANWGNAPGNGATAGWVAGNHANFSAGTGVTGASLITVDGTQTLANLTVDEGDVTLTGGALNFGAGARNLTVAGGASLAINSDVAANGALTFRGRTTFGGAVTNTVSGNALDISTGGVSARVHFAAGSSLTAASGAIRVGVNGSGNTTNTGALYQSGDSTLSALTFTMGTAAGAGAVNASYYRIADTATLGVTNMTLANAGAAATTAVFDQAGGTVNVGAYVRIANVAATSASMNLTGGVFNFNGAGTTNDNSFVVGYANGRGELNVRDAAHLNLGATALRISHNANSAGLVSLGAGGVISASHVTAGGGSSVLAFDGGTLRATADSANFIHTANNDVHAGGARIDTNGFAVTVSQALRAPAGDGVQSVAVLDGGSGFTGAPLVSITGGGGSGATGYAVMSADGARVVSIIITSPGVGYTSAPTVSLIGGDGAGVVLGAVNLAEDTSGALTKIGAGTLTLTAVNTYAGGTFIDAGGLVTGATGTLGSGNITVATGASLTLGNDASIADEALLFFSAGSAITLASGTETLGNIVFGDIGIAASGLYSAAQLNDYFGLASGDEVFFGAGFYDVGAIAIPEPSAFGALAGIACLLLAGRRRRR